MLLVKYIPALEPGLDGDLHTCIIGRVQVVVRLL